jgi:hypothetical protein
LLVDEDQDLEVKKTKTDKNEAEDGSPSESGNKSTV